MYAEEHSVDLITDASGDATGFTPVVTGRLIAVIYTPDGSTPFDAGADITITGERSGQALLTLTDQGGTGGQWAPRQPTHDNAGAASLYAGAGEPVEDHYVLAAERIKVVIAQGGDTKSGTLTFIIG